jgi:undecaprenyl-diphosphatase
MPIIQALVLGIVQGLTEFIPVSSDGHLNLVPFIFGWKEPSLAFILAVHIGTLIAVAYVFRATVLHLIKTLVGYKRAPENDRRLLRLIIVATIPAVIVGLAVEKAFGSSLERPVLAAILLGVNGYWLVTSESRRHEREIDPVQGQEPLRDETSIENKDALLIGMAQAVAILPGISRSGTTIGTGLRLGMTRESAVRFSFLMSIPVIFGAILTKIPEMLHASAGGQGAAFAIGIVASAVTGFFAVKWTLGVVVRRGLRGFGIYCFFAMIAGLLTALARG